MGRSVSYLNHATIVTYCSPEFVDFDKPEEEQIGYFDWDEFRDDLENQLIEAFPSLSSCKRWEGREDRIFLENNLVEIGIAEYCGLVSVSIRPLQSDGYYSSQGIAENWVNRISKRFKEIVNAYNGLTLIGRASNGEAFYQRAQ